MEVKNVAKSARRAGEESGQDPGDYYALLVSLAVFCLLLFVGTAVFSAPISQFVLTIEKTIAGVGGR